MVREKKSMIGFDPLAWLDDEQHNNAEDLAANINEKDEANASSITQGLNEPLVEKNTSAEIEKVSVKMISVLGRSLDEAALLQGHALAKDVLQQIVEKFYAQLFEQHPELKAIFKETTEMSRSTKLSAALSLLVNNIHNEDVLKTTLSEMGIRHQGYGVLPEHYAIVANLLVESFSQSVGKAWTKNMSSAWLELLLSAAVTMCAAYQELPTATETSVAETNPTEPQEVLSVEKNSSIPIILLQRVQDISKSLELKNDMISLVNDTDEISIDASAVERIDGSAMQLLCAFFDYAHQNRLIINWLKPTDVLIESAKTLGMQKLLELN